MDVQNRVCDVVSPLYLLRVSFCWVVGYRDAVTMLGDAIATLGDAIATLGDAIATLGDAIATLGDAITV
ncbi:hypothetical protein Tco_0886605 [Tanacetum coccineum]